MSSADTQGTDPDTRPSDSFQKKGWFVNNRWMESFLDERALKAGSTEPKRTSDMWTACRAAILVQCPSLLSALRLWDDDVTRLNHKSLICQTVCLIQMPDKNRTKATQNMFRSAEINGKKTPANAEVHRQHVHPTRHLAPHSAESSSCSCSFGLDDKKIPEAVNTPVVQKMTELSELRARLESFWKWSQSQEKQIKFCSWT